MQRLMLQSILGRCCWVALLGATCQALLPTGDDIWTAYCPPTNITSPLLEAAQKGNATGVVAAFTTTFFNATAGNSAAEQVATADPLVFATLLASALYPYQPPVGCAAAPGQPSPLNSTQAQALGKGLAALLTDPELSCTGMDNLAGKIIRGMAYAMEKCTGPTNMGPGSEASPFQLRLQPKCCYITGPTLAAALSETQMASDRRALRALASAMTQLYDAQSVGAAVYDVSLCVASPCDVNATAGGCCAANYTATTCNGSSSRLQGNASVVSLGDPIPVEVGTVRLWTGANSSLPGSLAGSCRCPDLMTYGGGYVGTRIPEELPRRRLAAVENLGAAFSAALA